jgi:rSAM/selenodomain-associated transferase 2
MISVIIPTYNEASQIQQTIQKIWLHDHAHLIKEIIIADGGSTDGTIEKGLSEGVAVHRCSAKGRAVQMNLGAAEAKGSILYFLHADTIPPVGFSTDILRAVQKGYIAGCYRLDFDYQHWFLRANCWFTRFNFHCFRFGDQSLFIKTDLFSRCGGFCEKHTVLEDQEIIYRIRKKGKFIVINKRVITSTRKYLDNGIFKTQGIFYLIYAMYQLGFSQQQLLVTYRNLIRQDKL